MTVGRYGVIVMKRIVKDFEVRRTEIILTAEQLFAKKGYEKTSVEAIIKEAGIAKGTFYYYFKAKKDVLAALVEAIATKMEQHFRSILERDDLTAIKKLKLMLKGPEKQALVKSSVMKIIHKPENRELQEQLNIQSIKIIAPLIAKVLDQGNKEGDFKAKISVESVQLVLAGSQFILDSGLFNWTEKKQFAFLKTLQTMFELMTGAKSGSFDFITKQ